jgi:A/G-specific adenine glycosylase
MRPAEFYTRVLDWFARHGRKDLPWQTDPTPYRVWVSEIMLQQTQVATVIPYYERFMGRFPDAKALAHASPDQVLHHWSGLGYYARARNLHAAARLVAGRYQGCFPKTLDELRALPGIGRSTAGAILSLACGQRHPILEGNVKRVLARFHAVEGWPGQASIERRLWVLAERYTPPRQVPAYTQAIMDLGATLCTRGQPGCGQCPLAINCKARLTGRQRNFPSPRPRRELPRRQTRMMLVSNDAGEVLLERRPPAGIWGGLWSLPEVAHGQPLEAWCREHLGLEVRVLEKWSCVQHTFSHFHLEITPVLGEAVVRRDGVRDDGGRVWRHPGALDERGLAAPVKCLLQRYTQQQPKG